MKPIDRYRGALVGLAACDALGTTVEFRPPGAFQPMTNIVGGGPFGLKPGQWTDDTSMALCLAESLIEKRGFDPVDQLERYVRWYRNGHLSSTGACFDIGGATSQALRQFERTHAAYCGSTDSHTAGNGSIMRLAPEIDEIAQGSFKRKEPPAIKGTGYVVQSLEAALWAFHKCTDFREGALLAVNLGDDADTTGAVFGQIAGAFYGYDGIPLSWRDVIAEKDTVLRLADGLGRQ